MDKSDLGHKLQSVAKAVLIIGLVQAGITCIFAVTAMLKDTFIQDNIAGYNYMMYSTIINAANTALWSTIRSVVMFYALKGFGHLIINSDKMVEMQTEALRGRQAEFDFVHGEDEQE